METAKGSVQPRRPALRLMSLYRLRIEEIKGIEVVTSYTRWVECVQAKGAENQEIYLTFSPRFERIWLKARNGSLSMFPINRPISDCEANIRLIDTCVAILENNSVDVGTAPASAPMSAIEIAGFDCVSSACFPVIEKLQHFPGDRHCLPAVNATAMEGGDGIAVRAHLRNLG